MPKSWRIVRLSEVAEQCLGKMLDAQKNRGRPLPYLRNPNVRWFEIDTSNLREMPFEEHELDRYGLLEGDVVICEGGEAGRAAIWDGRLRGVKFQKALHRVRPGPDLLNRYLVYRLKSDYESGRLADYYTGATIKHLTGQDLARYRFPLPPFPEQQRIVEALDQAEVLRAKRRAALAKLDTLVQSIFLDMFGDPATNPKGWPRCTLGDIATFIGGGTPSRANPEFFKGSICWATSKDMKCDFLDDTQEHITLESIAQSATNLVPAGTILVVVKSKILAHSLPVVIARIPTCFGQDLKGITVSDGCDVAFVTTALRYGRRWLLERARGINTEGLTLEHLKGFPLVRPPFSEQQEFARRAAAVEKLKAAQRTSLAELDALFASLQHRAFQGDL